MKKLILILLILINCKEKAKILSVEVCSVSDLIETPFSLKPERFFYNFEEGHELKRRTITSDDSIVYVTNILTKMKADPEWASCDTRAVLLIKYATHTDTISGNAGCVVYHGKTYNTPNDLGRIFWGKSFKPLD